MQIQVIIDQLLYQFAYEHHVYLILYHNVLMHHAMILHDNQQYRLMYHQHQRLQHQVHVVLLKNNELMIVTKEKNKKKEKKLSKEK